MNKPIIHCDCIDPKTLTNLKMSLVKMKDEYTNDARKEQLRAGKPTPKSQALLKKSKEIHLLIPILDKIKPCP